MKALSLLIKPASGNCNMRCKYCFYVDEMNHRSVSNLGIMNLDTLYNILDKSINSVDEMLNIAFQGGEPTLAGLSFFEKVVEYVDLLNVKAVQVNYSLQSNGYALDKEWIAFFKKHNFLIGISLDGGQEVHDKYRIDAKGEGTYNRVMASIELLQEYEVDFNILTVVHAETVKKVNQVYNFFRRNNLGFQQYIECLDPLEEEAGIQEYSLTPEGYGEFLIALFKKYYRDMSEGRYVYNRYFENLIGIMLGQHPESCAMGGHCGDYLTIEADGSVYPCDFYVLDEWKLGNFNVDTIEEITNRRTELQFVEMSMIVPDECSACKWYPLCRNACRRSCEPTTMNTREVNYFCESYKRFFEYAYPQLEELYRRTKR